MVIDLAEVKTHEIYCSMRPITCVCGVVLHGVVDEDYHKTYICAFKSEQCVYCGATVRGEKKQTTKELMEEHLEGCRKRAVLCTFCHLSFSIDAIKAHQSACTKRIERCQSCGQYLESYLMETHPGNCEMRSVGCDRCGHSFPLRVFRTHLNACVAPDSDSNRSLENSA